VHQAEGGHNSDRASEDARAATGVLCPHKIDRGLSEAPPADLRLTADGRRPYGFA